MKSLFLITAMSLALILGVPQKAEARAYAIKEVKALAENQLKQIIMPVLNKYCVDQCKILNIDVDVEVSVPEETSPGFDEAPGESLEYVPSSAKVTMLIDDLVGSQSKGKLLNLIQEYINVLEYPVILEARTAPFPLPVTTSRKVTELRQRAEKKFRDVMEDLFRQLCPDTCLLADFKLDAEAVNIEEIQYGSTSDFEQDGDLAIKIKKIGATIILDSVLKPEERANILEMARLRTSNYTHIELKGVVMQFPSGKAGRMGRGAGYGTDKESENNELKSVSDSKSETKNDSKENKNLSQTESNQRQDKYEKYEKIERVENGDAVQEQIKRFGIYAVIFGCAILSLLIFLVLAYSKSKGGSSSKETIIQNSTSNANHPAQEEIRAAGAGNRGMSTVSKRYEIERLKGELTALFAEQPKVAKQVFTRVLTEEGVEVTSAYITIFGESIVMDMLRDPSLQSDLADLTEYYAKNPVELSDDEQLDLLKSLYNKAIASKMVVFGNRSAGLFEFLVEMDARQILEMIQNESMTVKAIVMTQCDPQKRAKIFGQLDEKIRMDLLAELSRIDHLPRDYIHNVAYALNRKRKENPRLNTESLPGSDVLVNLLERVPMSTAKNVVKSLIANNPDSASAVKAKLVSVESLAFLRDQQLLDVILSLKHDELLQFLKGSAEHVRNVIFSKSPPDLVADLQEELTSVGTVGRDVYQNIERKILSRIKVLANEGTINLIETNERMFMTEDGNEKDRVSSISQKKAVGW